MMMKLNRKKVKIKKLKRKRKVKKVKKKKRKVISNSHFQEMVELDQDIGGNKH
jgi:hypothetical protein